MTPGRARPDLDARAMRTSGRILRLARVKATLPTSGAMTHRLDRLEADDWIERRRDPKDRFPSP